MTICENSNTHTKYREVEKVDVNEKMEIFLRMEIIKYATLLYK
jgi:hypothetical protein